MKHLWRRRNLTWLGLLLAFALVIAACGDDAGETTTTTGAVTTTEATTTTAGPTTTAATTTTLPPGKPYGGQALYASDQEPPTLNTFAPGGDNFIVAIIAQTWQCGTQEIDGFTLELTADLVTELPSVANGGIVVNADGSETINYVIRDEAVWEDGTPVSGYDYEFTYQTIMDPDYPIFKQIYEDIIPESVVAGDKTFSVTLTAPTVQAELIFGGILPMHQIEGTDFMADYNETGYLSCGPFKVDQWQKGEFVKVVRNDNFWKTDPETGQQLPYLDSIVFRQIPETASMINAFKAREVDMINPPPSVETIEDLQTLESQGASVEVLSGPIWEHLNFQFGANHQVRNPGSYNLHLNYRKAVAHAIDKDKIVDEILKGQVEPMSSYVDAFTPSLSHANWDQYNYDPAMSQQYIAALCEEEGVDCAAVPPKAVFSTTSNNAARVLLSELFIEMFNAAGIAYEAQLEDSSLFFGETLDFGNWDFGEWAWVGTPGLAGLVSIHDLFDPEAPAPDGQNYYRWGTPEVTDRDPAGYNQAAGYQDENSARFGVLRDLMNATVDEGELAVYFEEAEAILADQLVIIPLYQRLDPGAVWADTIGGYKHNPSQAGDTWNCEFWYRLDLA
ncbi:MAG: ABC transporter substrate-binding protein [Actinomycetota bacterium]